MANLTIHEVKDYYSNKGWSKNRIAMRLNVTYDELDEFMTDNAITKEIIELKPTGRVQCSQSPILDSQTVSLEDLKIMLGING